MKHNCFSFHNKLMKYICLALILLIAHACKTNKDSSAIETIQPILDPPQVTILSNLPDSLQPKTILLKDVPKPLIVTIPTKVGGTYPSKNGLGEIVRVKLLPTVIKPLQSDIKGIGLALIDSLGKSILGLGGKSDFTTFTTDNGLALDGIFSSFSDRSGNLWFGTLGAGVSKYDGKSFTTYTLAQGMAHTQVSHTIQDNAGNLWFATRGGLSKYDGYSFTTISTAQGLINNFVNRLLEDKNGNIWMTTFVGVSKYDPIKAHFTNFTVAEGLSNNIARGIQEDNEGNIWICTRAGLSRYDPSGLPKADGKVFTSYTTVQGLVDNNLGSMLKDKAGNLWISSFAGMSKIDPKKYTGIKKSSGATWSFEQDGIRNYTDPHWGGNISSLLEDQSGNIWIGKSSEGISVYNPSKNTFTNITTDQGLVTNEINTLTEDKNGNIWIGTNSGGVCKYNGASILNFITPQGIGLSSIFSLQQDQKGNLWLGTLSNGVIKYDGRSFTNYTSAQGLGLSGDFVFSIVNDRSGTLWFGTNGSGLTKYTSNAINAKEGFFNTYTTDQGLANNSINNILEDDDGIFWIGTGNGLSAFTRSGDHAGFTNYTKAQGLAGNGITCVKQDKYGNLWIGTGGKGISVFDLKRTKKFINYSTAQGLCGSAVNNITIDKAGNFWVSTNGDGLSRIASQEIDHLNESLSSTTPYNLKFENLSVAGGLPDDVVYDIISDHQGNVFIGTNQGITVIPDSLNSKPFAVIKDKMEYYNAPNGYPIKDLNTRALYCDHEGIIWAGTGSEKTGLVRFDYASIHKTNKSPYLVIQQLKVNGENISWSDLKSKGLLNNQADSAKAKLDESLKFRQMLVASDRLAHYKKFGTIQFDSISKFYSIPQNLILPNEHNNITIEFNAIETDKPQLVNYQYILEGYDKEWSPIQKSTSATFGNISGGTYTFKVKAQGTNRVWSEPVIYTFKVMPPWYASWWAYLSYILLAAGGIYTFVRWRLKQLKEKHDELEKIIETRTHELKQRAEELGVINSVQEGLAKELDMQGIYDLVGEKIREIFNPQVIDIVTYDRATDLLHDRYAYEKGDRSLVGEWKPYGVRKHVIDTGQVLLLNKDIDKKLIEFNSPVIQGAVPKSAVWVPMISNNEVKGMISLQNLDRENVFTDSDVNLLSTLANSMVVALENARLFDETNRLLKETEQRTAELSVINSVQEGLVREMDMQGIYKLVGDRLCMIFPDSQTLVIRTFDHETGLEHFHYTVENGEHLYITPRPFIWESKQIILTKKPLDIESNYAEISIENGESAVTEGQPVMSAVFVPMIVGEQVKGSISLQNVDRENAFNESDIRLLTTLSNSMSVALENARLFDETNRLLKETEQRTAELAVINSVQEGLAKELDMQGIYDLVGDRLCELFPESQTLVIRTFNHDTHTEHWQYAKEKGMRQYVEPRPFNWNSKQLIEHKRPLDIKDNYVEIARKYGSIGVTAGQAPKSALFVPMLSGDIVKGSVSIQNVDEENAFNESDLRLLTTITNSMSVALESARLFDETTHLLAESKQRAAELGTVNSISKALASQLDPADLVQMVGDQLKDLFKANIVYLALLNSKTNIIDFPYQYGEDMPQRKLGEGLTSKVILSGEPLLINKDLDETTTRMGIQRIGLDSASYLGVPIPVGDKIIGVLSVQSTEHENRFNDNDLRLLTTIASSVGVALNNATLFEDVKQAKMEAEASSKQAEKANEAKSAFLSTVSHELRTPLTSVLGFAKIIKKRLEERIFPLTDKADPKTDKAIQQVSENLNVVISEGQRLTSLINDVLDLAKIEAGKMNWNEENVSMPAVAERAIAATTSLFDQKSLILVKHVDENLPDIIGDNDKLIQVMVNLISNSVKFTPTGTITCSIYQKGEEIRVSIADTGIGIAPKDHAAVFEQFKQVGDTLTDKPKGTGLGLPICKEIVEHHGGRIWLESELGKGSTFIFAIPITKTSQLSKPIHLDDLVKQLKAEVSQSPLNVVGHASNILIVDDDDSIRSLLEQELGDAGYLIDTARNGKEALAKVKQQRPDLILLDIMMPEMNGFDVAAILKNDPQTLDIPIIVISIIQDKARGFRIGIDRYLNKPIDTNILHTEIDSLLKQGKSKKKVMIVDEDSGTLNTLTEVLKAKGYAVTESNGIELLEKAITHQPDIIIINSLLAEQQEKIKALRFENGMENVLFLVYQ